MGNEVVTLSKEDNQKVISLRIGDEIIIRLPEGPSTGYLWVETAEFHNDFTMIDSKFEQHSHSPAFVGGNGTRVFRISPKVCGSMTAMFVLRRPWIMEEAHNTFTAHVDVQ